MLRTQMGSGPLALTGLRGFRLPDEIFRVDTGAAEEVFAGNGETPEMDVAE